jgi:hypothetical protein
VIAGGVPTVDGLDQTQGGDLLGIPGVLAIGIGLGHPTHQRHEALDHLVTRRPVTGAVIAQDRWRTALVEARGVTRLTDIDDTSRLRLAACDRRLGRGGLGAKLGQDVRDVVASVRTLMVRR